MPNVVPSELILDAFPADRPNFDPWGCDIRREHVANYLDGAWYRFDLLVRLVQRHVPPSSTVLEVGCAYGATLLALRDRGFTVIGFDHPHAIPAYCKPLIQGRVPVHPWDIHADEPCGSCDCVIAAEILEHLLMSPAGAVAKLAEMVAPGGTLILTTPNFGRIGNVVRLALGRPISDAFPDEPARVDGVVTDLRQHPREPVMQELVAACVVNGLAVVERGFFYAPSPKRRALYALLPDRFRPDMYVVARRPGRAADVSRARP